MRKRKPEIKDASQSTNGASKRTKFEELAVRRVTNVRKAIRVLRNLTNANAYEFTPADWTKILGVLREDLNTVEKLSKSRKISNEELGFSF